MNVTWSDIERAALNDAHLHAAVTRARQGVQREQVLMEAALALAASNQRLRDDNVDLVMRIPAKSCVIAPAAGKRKAISK